MTTKESWDYSVDVLVVGSGNGALTSALCCYEMGIKDVLVIEKAELYGGTSSVSGGGVWVPCNRYAMAAGADDSIEQAREYLHHTIPKDDVPQAMIDTYLNNAPKMIDFLHRHTRVRYQSLAHYPDYYSDKPGAKNGHRSMEPEPFDASLLGADYDTLRPTHPMMHMFGVIAFTQVEAATLIAQQKGWIGIVMKMLINYLMDIPWRLRTKFARRLTTGSAGIARLRLSMKDRDIPLWLNSPLLELIEEQGEIVGARVRKGNEVVRIQARKAVICAAGGFEHNQKMREEYLPAPTNAEWSSGVKTNTGDTIVEGIRLGAQTRLMHGAWWCTTISTPGEAVPRLSIMEKSYPGSCMVNKTGARFANESQNYMAFQKDLYKEHTEQVPCSPSFHVFDSRFRRNYIVGPMMTSQLKPDWTIPRRWYDEGFIAKADTIAELAHKMGIDEKGLEETVGKMNKYARTGKDAEYRRGEAVYDRYYGDPTVSPNPCLAPIDEAPFYAMKVDAGDFGTQGGLVTNTDGQVMGKAGHPINKLYAVGNCSAAVLPTYPGPGSTLGPAMTFAYQAAKHISGFKD